MQGMLTAREFSWDMAHMLSGHEGLCKNLHGHTYKMLVEVSHMDTMVEHQGAAEGMVVDFQQLDQVVKTYLISPLDHATMINTETEDPFEEQLYKLLAKYGKKFYAVSYRPTAENMAMDFFGVLNNALAGEQIRVTAVTIYETPKNFATYKI